MFQYIERVRQNPAIKDVIFFFGYLYLAFWNHIFNRVPLYWFRHFVARKLYGLKGRANLGYAVTFLSPWNISTGDKVNIQWGCFLDGRGGIEIGENVDITIGVKILTEQHDINSPDYDTVKKPVIIHDNVVIGSWALIMPGVTIGEGAVIAAGSVVVKDIAPYTMAAGNPAVSKRDRNREIRYVTGFRRPFH